MLRLLFCAFLFLGLPFVTEAQSQSSQESLKGLSGFMVVVEDMKAYSGLTDDTVKTDIELSLRKAGVRVLERAEWLGDPRSPVLYLIISTIERDGLVAYHISLQVQQLTRLKDSSGTQLLSTTWDSGSIGTVGLAKIRQIREYVIDHVAILLNHYLKWNPKQ